MRRTHRHRRRGRDYYDVWLPELAPSAELVSWALVDPWTDARYCENAERCHRGLLGELLAEGADVVLREPG